MKAVLLRDLIKMAKAIVTVKIMPENPEIDLNNVEVEAKKVISKFI